MDLIQEVEKLGGRAKAIETGILKCGIEEAAARTQARIDSGQQTKCEQVSFWKEAPIDILKLIIRQFVSEQIDNPKRLKEGRNQAGRLDRSIGCYH